MRKQYPAEFALMVMTITTLNILLNCICINMQFKCFNVVYEKLCCLCIRITLKNRNILDEKQIQLFDESTRIAQEPPPPPYASLDSSESPPRKTKLNKSVTDRDDSSSHPPFTINDAVLHNYIMN
eukprot:228683_1